MLIRQAQIDIFTEQANDEFVRRLAKYLKRTYGDILVDTRTGCVPLRSISHERLVEMAGQCNKKGRRSGLRWESSIACFAVLMFLNGPRFDEHRLIRLEMENKAVPVESLADHLALVISEATWEEARVEYPGGWEKC